MTTIKRETWNIRGKNRYVYVARDNGRLKSWSFPKKKTKSSFERTYKQNKTFNPNVRKTFESLTNVNEITIKGSKQLPNPHAQYVVQETFQGQKIIARSQKIGSKLTQNLSDAKRRARNSFWELVSQVATGGYDSTEGIVYEKQVKDYEEYFVYYSKK